MQLSKFILVPFVTGFHCYSFVVSATLDEKLRNPSSLTTKASASQPHNSEANPNKKTKLKHPKSSTSK